jgi:hypothetical protein
MLTWWEEVERKVSRVLPPSDDYDGVFFAVPHREYVELDLGVWIRDKQCTLVLDAFMVWKREQRRGFRKRGIRIEAVGVANGL